MEERGKKLRVHNPALCIVFISPEYWCLIALRFYLCYYITDTALILILQLGNEYRILISIKDVFWKASFA